MAILGLDLLVELESVSGGFERSGRGWQFRGTLR